MNVMNVTADCRLTAKSFGTKEEKISYQSWLTSNII